MNALSIKTVPQWLPQLMAICLQLFQFISFAKATRVGKSYFLVIGLLMASPATLYAAPPGNALSFNGANTYVSMNDVNLGTADFTLEGWIKPNVLSGYIYSSRTTETTAPGNWFIVHLKTFELANCASSYLAISGNFTPTVGVWYHFAIVRNSTTITLYFNGVLDKQVADNASLRNLNSGINVTHFGGNTSQNAGWFNGQIDEFRVWNVARTQTQIQSNLHQTLVGNEANLVAYYNFDQTSGTILPDVTGHGHDGTLFNGPSWTAVTWKYGYPYVTTGTVSALTATTVAVGGTVVDAGISAVTASGICYATSASPTTPCTTDGPTGIGSIPGSLTGLTPQGTTYYARPYATNSAGTIYSYASDVTFTTRYLPVIAQGTSVSATMSEDGSPTTWSTPTISATNMEGDTMTWTLATPATHGTATVSGTGASPTLTYSPIANYNGTDSFVVQVADIDGTDTLTVNVTVTSVNDIPTFTASDPPAVLENSGTHTITGWATFNPGLNDTDNVLTYTVNNITNPSLFSAPPSVNTSGTLTYTLATNQSGSSNFNVTVQDNGGTANSGVDLSTTATFILNVSAPEINLSQVGTTLSNGSSYNFGAILIGQSSPAITFTIDNSGSSNLLLSGSPKLTVTGTDASEFRVTDNTTSPIVPGGHTTLMVTFAPTVMGPRTALLTIASNDGDESNSTVTLQGVGLTPDLKVKQGSLDLPNGGSFDVGPSAVGHQVHYPFTIDNLGNSELTLNGSSKIQVSGANAGEFSIDDTTTTTPIAAGTNTTFILTFIPTSLGNKTAILTIANNDQDEGNYTVTVTGTAEPHKNLQVTVAGSGQGSVTSDLEGIDCETNPQICNLPVIDSPRWVTLTAVPAVGAAFTGWTGDPACQTDGKVFVMADTTCVATFELNYYTLTVEKNAPAATVTGEGINCPDTCQATYLYGTTVKLEASTAPWEWEWVGWGGSCDSQGQVTLTSDKVCRAQYQEDLNIPARGDGNGDGILDARQPNVISLPDKVTGRYVTFAVQPETCVISDVYTDLPDNYGKPENNKPMPQGLIYFELACPQAQISLYYHAVSTVKRNFIFRKFGPSVPGNESTAGWYLLPNVTFEAVMIGGKSVVKASYTLNDGELGDSTGVDGRIVDPGGIMVK